MNVRLLLGLGLPVVVGFALGIATSPRAKLVGEKVVSEGEANPDRRIVSALSPDKPSAAALLSRVANHPKAGGFSRLMAYMRLVKTAEIDELPELLRRIRREVDVTDVEMIHAEFLSEMLVKRWTAEDPLGALQAVVSGEPPELRDHEWTVLETVVGDHPREAWEAASMIENRGQRTLMQGNLMDRIAAEQPEIALELLAKLNPNAERKLLRKALPEVAKKFPLEAMALAESLPVGAVGIRSTLVLMNDGAHREFQRIGKGDGEGTALVSRVWAESDPAAALAWAEAQKGSRREPTLTTVVAVWGRKEPAAAMEYAQANLGRHRQREVFESVLASSSLSIDQRRATAEEQGWPPTVTGGYIAFARDWIMQDASELGAWLAQRPGDGSDRLIHHASRHWVVEQQADAAVGVMEIEDPAMRQIAIDGVAETLHGQLKSGYDEVSEIEMAPEVRAAFEALKAEDEEVGNE